MPSTIKHTVIKYDAWTIKSLISKNFIACSTATDINAYMAAKILFQGLTNRFDLWL